MPKLTLFEFQDRTAIIPAVVADRVWREISDRPVPAWFVEHVELRVVYMYNTNRSWQRKLNNEILCMHFLEGFVRHWRDAYLLNPSMYKKQNPLSEISKPQSLPTDVLKPCAYQSYSRQKRR